MAQEHDRIMIVDGSAVSRKIATRVLSDAMPDVEVVACGNASEALARLEQQRFDLITTSLMLPDIDGIELCRRIRSSNSHHYTPLIVISGDAEERLEQEGFSAGVTDYFDKSRGYQAFAQFIMTYCQGNTGLVGRILYVEDSRTVATVTMKILDHQGMKVTHVTSAEEALETLKRSHEAGGDLFDMVITDFYLEGKMTGGDLLYNIRKQLRYSLNELPVLVITGNEGVKGLVEVIHAGANDFVNKPLAEEILMARVRTLLTLKHQHEALLSQNQRMERVANTDALTGVYNRHYLGSQGVKWLHDGARRPVWAMLIDLDDFREVNGTYGHLVGDHVLAALGSTLQRVYSDGLVARFGGEEFAVLVSGLSYDEASGRAEKLRRKFERLKPDGVAVTVSIGMASADEHRITDLNTLLAIADKALYAAKKGGRNRVFISRPGQKAQA